LLSSAPEESDMNPNDPKKYETTPGTQPGDTTKHPDPTHQRPPADNERRSATESDNDEVEDEVQQGTGQDQQQDKARRSDLAGDQDLP
jgi:hypothetical protein